MKIPSWKNLPTIVDQVRTARALAPNAAHITSPRNFDPPAPRPMRDPRNLGLFAAA